MRYLATALVLVCAAPPLSAQVPGVEAMVQEVRVLATRLQGLKSSNAEQRLQRTEAVKAIDAFLEPLLAGHGWSLEHFVQVSSPLVEVYPEAVLRVVEVGLKRFPDARVLHDQTGLARLSMATRLKACAERLTALRAAEHSFRKALSVPPDSHTAHLGLSQVLDLSGRYGEALGQLDVAQRLAVAAEQALPLLPLWRGGLLLRAGKPAEALTVLNGEGINPALAAKVEVLVLRAHAMAGDLEQVESQAKSMAQKGDAARVALEHADALLWLGQRSEALALLAKKPVIEKGSEGAPAQALLAQSYAALELVATVTEFDPRSPVRVLLTKALGHSYSRALPDKEGKVREVDLSASPVLISHLLHTSPVQPVKQWGNRLLLVLCLKASPAWKPSPDEAVAVKAVSGLPSLKDLPAILLAMRFAVGDPEQACGLASWRIAESLQPRPAAPK